MRAAFDNGNDLGTNPIGRNAHRAQAGKRAPENGAFPRT